MGTRLATVFVAAGLHVPTLRHEALAGAARDAVRLMTDLATTLRSDVVQLGFVSAGDPDFSELAERIEAGLGPAGTVICRAEIGAWTTA